MAGNQRKHDWLVDKVRHTPDAVNIDAESVLSSADEYALLYRGHYYVVPDVYFDTEYGAHYVEVKSGNTPRLYSKGMYQLERILEWHEMHGRPTPDVRLAMPRRPDYKRWLDMLYDLDTYRP